MPRLISFLKTSLIGGALVVLPAWLAVLLLVHGVMQLKVLVMPIMKELPESVQHPLPVACLLMLMICFAVGIAVRTAVGRKMQSTAEDAFLHKVPGYTMMRNVARQLGDLEKNHGFKPALIEVEEALAPGFIVEEHPGGEQFTVFIPSAPTPAAGTVFIIAASRVHPINVPVTKMFQCVTKWGTGSTALLAAMKPPAAASSGETGQAL